MNSATKLKNLRPNLAPDHVNFLEHARVVDNLDNLEVGCNLYFFYWVQNLASPEFMLEQAELFQYDGEEGRFLVLYAMSNFHGHFCGLV